MTRTFALTVAVSLTITVATMAAYVLQDRVALQNWSITIPSGQGHYSIAWITGYLSLCHQLANGSQEILLQVPGWFLLVSADCILAWGVSRQVPPRPKKVCANCGYDLRATPDRCPECGTTPLNPSDRRL